MALKTLHFVPGLSRTPLLFIPRYLTNILFKNILQKEEISRIENLEISKVDPGKLVDSFSPRDGPVLRALRVNIGGINKDSHTSKWLLNTLEYH